MIPRGCYLWYLLTVKEYGPEDITYAYPHKGHMVAMEYGIKDGEEFPHLHFSLTQRLNRG